MDEVIINTINWKSPEYAHKERSNDWFWLLGLVTIVSSGIAVWLHNYVFAIFLLISGGCLIIFSIKHPQEIDYTIETGGFKIGKDLHTWKSLKSFNIKNNDVNDYSKLLVETSKYILPIYTIYIPKEIEENVKETLLKFIPRSEIDESRSMLVMDKLGF